MLLEKNIELLSGNSLHWIGEADENDIYPEFIIRDNDNKNVEYFRDNDAKIISVIDKYDEEFALNAYKKEIIFIFGLTNVKEIKEIIRRKNKDSLVLILEPRISLFQYALMQKKLDFLNQEKVFLYADAKNENIIEFLNPFIHDINLIGLFKNIVVYLNGYYRKYDFEITKNLIKMIQQYISSVTMSLGNSVEDSIQGLQQNLMNLTCLNKAKNPYYLKDKFKGETAVIVAAGPSLNKNIHYLKEYRDKVIIIAVDTILERLLNEGITPHFVCTVERLDIVYEYFYKDKSIPKEVSLVAPLVLDPRIFETFKGEFIIPFRTEVTEFRWLKKVLEIEEDVSTPVGLSCAHMAFGIAQHFGCSPIIMIGQDLAYDELTGKTHVSGTMHDEKNQNIDNSNDEFVMGYYGEQVKTTKIWNTFRHWFELQILEKNLYVINCTEGGAKIHHAHQMPLKEALEKCASGNILTNIYKDIKNSYSYDINIKKIFNKLEIEIDYINNLKNSCELYLKEIHNTKIDHAIFKKNGLKINKRLNEVDLLINEVFAHELIMHNAQPLITNFSWEYNSIEQILNISNLVSKIGCVSRFVLALIITLNEIKLSLEKSLDGFR